MDNYGKVLDRMRVLCSRREYCSSDILKKAHEAFARLADGESENDRDDAEKVLESLVKDRYIDDLRYATAFARDKSAISGWGAMKIRYALVQKGISPETISAAMESVDRTDAETRLIRLLEVRSRSLEGDPQCRMKLLRFALGRGYSYDMVSAALERVNHIKNRSLSLSD